jgi:hypothetical protein
MRRGPQIGEIESNPNERGENDHGLLAVPTLTCSAAYALAVFNGLLAPFLLVGILMIAGDCRIMNDHCSSHLCCATVGLTAILMVAAAVGLFAFQGKGRVGAGLGEDTYGIRRYHALTHFRRTESATDVSTSLSLESISTK